MGMSMNLSLECRPVTEAETESYFDPKQRPVDLTHLSRYTMGNSAVEAEVLDLFRRQTRLYFDKLSRAGGDDEWRTAVRVLKASARSVGAWQLLRAAEAAERLSSDALVARREETLRVLAAQIEEATQFIDSIL
jgi:hypothetical protein